LGKNLVRAAAISAALLLSGLFLTSGVSAGSKPTDTPSWATRPNLSGWFKIHTVNTKLLAPPRGVIFFSVLAGYAQPPRKWLVEAKERKGWKVIGQTGASMTLTDEFGTGHGIESNLNLPFNYGYASEAVAPGDVVAMIFDLRGLLPGAHYRFRAQGFEFEFAVPLRSNNKFPLTMPNQTDPGFSCRKRSDRLANRTETLRVDIDIAPVWRNMSNMACSALGPGVHVIRKRNPGAVDSVEYIRTDLLK
jgi:hypothetical protein